jgi:hypothetical protein
MENLEIKNSPFSVIRFGIGIFMTIVAITWLITFIDSHKVLDIIFCLFFVFYGLYNMTNGFGIEKSYISITESGLKIKLMDWIMAKELSDSLIENITLSRTNILINTKKGKAVKIKLVYMDTKQKSEIYNFLIEYAAEKKLVLIRDFDKAESMNQV